MLLECLIQRPGPTEVNLAGFKYRFEDDGTGARVADVNSEEHREHLLASGFYRIYDPTIRRQVEEREEARTAEAVKSANDPTSNTKSQADVVGLLIREFMPLRKDAFAEWMATNRDKVRAMPVDAKKMAVSKWNKLFPGQPCPVTE